ncbi:zinc finger CCCH-type with G patch domain-containing protein isoform X1 [Musca domestica]|uniref:Zinc finger CCCH-type with G patch domain-containing protein n=2 Tax=Musca domestica TaxID=7370 RepID=A0A9J7CHZ7_MUSDO|nr:zinc finger CCCH-type with G patch domain-containing protein isoform X1 [Musca domestica]
MFNVSRMEQFEIQLLTVEQSLSASQNESERLELLALKENLIELIALTQFSKDEEQPCENSRKKNEIDEEFKQFMNEMQEIDDGLKKLKEGYQNMVGEKCSAPHKHAWGAVEYHNAIICSIEKEAPIDVDGNVDVKFRILFTNPTHKEMLPCSYFLEGECRFDSENCHYSHGEVVSASALREYTKPDFSRLSRNCVVLAKMEDGLWQRGRVLCANFVEKECRVRLDNAKREHKEQDLKFENLLPIYEDDTSSDDADSDAGDTSQFYDSYISLNNALTYELSQPLGAWEKHTRGIGSKIMAKMGYIYGSGLGTNGRGIITPVSAQILPPGRSLDHCMDLREAANGDKDLFDAEKKMEREQKKQLAMSAKVCEKAAKRVDVFSFINDNVLALPTPKGKSAIPKKSLQSHTSKSLNVESVKVADDIRRKEREILEVEKSLKRNADEKSEICCRLKQKLEAKKIELNVLKEEQKCLSKEQSTRKTKEKLCIF